jgi:hypothetical protein
MYAGIQTGLAKDPGLRTGVSFGRSPARIDTRSGQVWSELKAAQGAESG